MWCVEIKICKVYFYIDVIYWAHYIRDHTNRDQIAFGWPIDWNDSLVFGEILNNKEGQTCVSLQKLCVKSIFFHVLEHFLWRIVSFFAWIGLFGDEINGDKNQSRNACYSKLIHNYVVNCNVMIFLVKICMSTKRREELGWGGAGQRYVDDEKY